MEDNESAPKTPPSTAPHHSGSVSSPLSTAANISTPHFMDHYLKVTEELNTHWAQQYCPSPPGESLPQGQRPSSDRSKRDEGLVSPQPRPHHTKLGFKLSVEQAESPCIQTPPMVSSTSPSHASLGNRAEDSSSELANERPVSLGSSSSGNKKESSAGTTHSPISKLNSE
ncbi:hypothetical protein M231_04102 [Tremella mesenterica]|uniref:Uncharacterized protein n=1 Tax=Tremella mesenterica TaxID=5217 RepID=A0A4Q1BLH0_TREME|nr:hypothetical protein M231_04102 [Tremella mesenterica]